MIDFTPTATLIRNHELFDLHQSGADVIVTAKSDRVRGGREKPFTIAEIRANPVHFLRPALANLERAGAVAVVLTTVDGKQAQLAIKADEWALGAGERQRYADWSAEVHARSVARRAKERAHDNAYNEGGEGYNPHRSGSAHSYGAGR